MLSSIANKSRLINNSLRHFSTKAKRKEALVITDNAASRIKELVSLSEKEQIYGVKVGVRRRGCNGYSYVMNYQEDESETNKLDEVVE